MACCVLGLMLVYQLIDAWQRLRALCGLPARACSRLLAWQHSARARRWRPALLVSFAAFELGLGGALAYQHRDHLQQGAQAVWQGSTAAYDSMCRRLRPASAVIAASPGATPHG